MKTISLCNWDEFQHYKDRDPPWIKLYRDILTTESWVLGTDISRLVQVASMLLAVRYKNKIPCNWTLLRKVASLDCTQQQFDESIAHLDTTGFLEVAEIKEEDDDSKDTCDPPASTLLATCPSDQIRSDQRRSDQSKNPSASATPALKAVPRESADPDWMLDFKLAYPNRAGDQGWRKAIRAANARMAEGHKPAEFIIGARRYAAFCEASQKTNTEFVKQACTFLGPDKPFLLPWHPPQKPETPGDRLKRALNGGHDDSRVIDYDPEFAQLTGS